MRVCVFLVWFRVVVATWIVASLAACAVQLSPAYDPELVSGLNSTNAEVMILFSALESGASADTFPTHVDKYDSVIGQLGALQSQAGARVVPPLSENAFERLSGVIDIGGVCADAVSCVNPSPASISEAITTLSMMKEVHQNRGLSAGNIALFRNPYVISIEQALAIENVLKRN